jgi:hypothetical protein
MKKLNNPPLHLNRVFLGIKYLNLLFLHLVKMFLLVATCLNEERIRVDYCTSYLHDSALNNFPFIGSSLEYESVGAGLLKDSSLMRIFPLPPSDTSQVSTLNMISNQVQ